MPRKTMITKDMLSDSAFALLREEGIGEVTARKLAARQGCSTQPIFHVYNGMDDIIREMFERAVTYFQKYHELYVSSHVNIPDVPFVALGLSYIRFAAEEPNLFRFLFLGKDKFGMSLYEMLNGEHGVLSKEVAAAKADGCGNPQSIFMSMWIFIHGAGCMTITGDYDLGEKETENLLVDSYEAYKGLE
ncbi:MAG: TetR/AcrR family transcriptional regulator [Lachnospiraceae bacterium]|nr:TetR/AcrR family transcriptional regulator [Lachnospiraceae bacterium]